MKVGILGFGRLGKLLAKNLTQDATVSVFDTSLDLEEVKKFGATAASLEEVCKSKILILCVPISQITLVANQIKELVTPDTLVVDVCSVKVHPMEELTSILPSQTLEQEASVLLILAIIPASNVRPEPLAVKH